MTTPEKMGRLTEQQDRGAEAQRILDTELFHDVIKGMQQGNLANWRECDPEKTTQMQRHHAIDQILEEFVSVFEEIAIKGENARKEMAKLAA